MKKTVKTALFAALVCFATSLFAAEPVSFLNETTFGLFNDETVDNFAWGVDDVNGMILGGFNPDSNAAPDDKIWSFNVGAGKYIGPFWFSLFETGFVNSKFTTTETTENDSVSNDGVNVDYVDTDYKKTTADTVDFKNNLFLSFAAENWGLQLGWKIVRTNPNLTAADNSYEKTYTTTTDEVIKEETKTQKENMVNTFSVAFNGIETPEFLPVSMFFRLDKVEFEWGKNGTDKTETVSKKTNGSIYGYTATDNEKKKTTTDKGSYKTTVAGTMGLTMSESEALVSKFELGESFDFAFNPDTKTVKTTRTREDAGEEYSYKQTETTAGKTAFLWTNVLVPKFVFEFTPDEKVSVNAAIGAGVSVGRTGYKNTKTVTTVTKTVTEDKSTGLSSETYSKTVALETPGQTVFQVEEEYTTNVIPFAQLGLIYKIKPEKFHLNLGLGLTYSTLSWKTTTKTNETVKTSTYKTSTNEVGYETVTEDTEEYHRTDGTGKGDVPANGLESKETVFTGGGDMDAEFAIGTTWFMNDKVQMDIAYSGVFNDLAFVNFGGHDGLLDHELKIQFTVKF